MGECAFFNILLIAYYANGGPPLSPQIKKCSL